MAEIDEALVFAVAGEGVDVLFEGLEVLGGHEVGEAMAGELFGLVAEAAGGVAINGEQSAVHVVSADDAETVLDELAVAGLTLADDGFGVAAAGDIHAGGDDEVDGALRVEERGGGPGDEADLAVAGDPGMFVALREGSGANGFEAAHDLFAILGRNETLPEGTADELGEGIAGDDLAGAIEAHDAAGGVEHEDKGADGVEGGVHEVAFDGEGLLDAAFGADVAFESEQERILIETGGDLAGDEAKRFALRLGEGARLPDRRGREGR